MSVPGAPRGRVHPHRAAPRPAGRGSARNGSQSNSARHRTLGVLAGVVALGLLGITVRAAPGLVAQGDLGGLVAVPAATSSASSVPDATPTVPATTPADTRPRASSTATAPKSKTDSNEGESTKDLPKQDARTDKVPATGPGSYRNAGLHIPAASTSGTLIRFDVRVEKNLDIDPRTAARTIEGVLNDKRSWRGSGRWRFELVDSPAQATLHAYLVTPGTTDRLCAPLLTQGRVSCHQGDRVVLNALRWMDGVDAYGSDMTGYRTYLVNHEFGHALGHGHLQCPGKGALAPVMMQQTKGLGQCRKNPWPLPGGD